MTLTQEDPKQVSKDSCTIFPFLTTIKNNNHLELKKYWANKIKNNHHCLSTPRQSFTSKFPANVALTNLGPLFDRLVERQTWQSLPVQWEKNVILKSMA